MKLFGTRNILTKAVEVIAVIAVIVMLAYEFSGVPWRSVLADLFTWKTLCALFLCFLTTWLLLYLDHRANLLDVICDVPGLVFGMLVSAAVLYFVYSVLKFVFEPN